MRKIYSTSIFVLIFSIMVTSKAHAEGRAAPMRYGQRVDSYAVFVPNSVCPQDTYQFEARLGDVVTIIISEISGNAPHLYLQDGEFLVEGIVSEDGRIVALENYTITNSQTPIIAIEAKAAESFTETTFSLSLTLVTEATTVNTPIETFTVGTRPSHIVSDASQLYVSNRDSHDISVLTTNGELITTIPISGSPSAMQWDGSRMWVADREGDSVYLLNGYEQWPEAFTVGGSPISMSYSESNQIMWIALYDDSQVVALDMDGREIARIDLPAQPSTVLAQPNSDNAWVALYADEGSSATKVLTVSLSLEMDESSDYLVKPYANDLAYGNGHVFVAYARSNILTIIDPIEHSQEDFEIDGGNIIEVFWDGNFIWLSLDSNAITVLDYNPDNQERLEQLETFALPDRPFGITYTEPYIWVANRGTPESPGNSVTRINTLELGLPSRQN